MIERELSVVIQVKKMSLVRQLRPRQGTGSSTVQVRVSE
nr:MAG TPA: hypothetical protein [Caudoviricetes sp.]